MRILAVISFSLLACCNASVIDQLLPSFATGHIINGQDAKRKSAPFIVSLSRNSNAPSHICGGTLIAKDWVLTAGHCVSEPKGMGIIAGLHDRTLVEETAQSRTVDWGKVHPMYDGNVGPYDIALLHVSKPFEFNDYVQAAVVPSPKEIHSGNVDLYGWGKDNPFGSSGARILQTVKTEIVKWEKCKQTLPDNAPLHEYNVCSDSLESGISACNGDSGGPLVRQIPGVRSELVGIVSWGYVPCGLANMPSVYTRVSAYLYWITEVQNAYYTLN